MKKIVLFCMIVFLLSSQVEVDAKGIPRGYGAKISKYEVQSTETALRKYGQKEVYRVNPESYPLWDSWYYNEYTKHYYLLRSYLRYFEENGGGTLILEKGTYSITNTLFIPSNVTIILEDGVNIVKSTYTGIDSMAASKSLMQFVAPSQSLEIGTLKKYNGVSNIKIIGVGKVCIDLKNAPNTMGFMLGHCSNITFRGIQFRNMNNGHFLEIDASQNVVVDHCNFTGAKKGSDYVKEAINIDTPDETTKGFNCPWSSHDKTPNRNISITNCVFSNMGRAIGTHKYSAIGNRQMIHNNILIKNNIIKNMYHDAPIRIMNWYNSKIINNTFTNIKSLDSKSKKTICRGVLASGTRNLTITKNYVSGCGRAFQFSPWKNNGNGKKYPAINNVLSSKNKKDLKYNKVYKLYSKEYYVRISPNYGSSASTKKINFKK